MAEKLFRDFDGKLYRIPDDVVSKFLLPPEKVREALDVERKTRGAAAPAGEAPSGRPGRHRGGPGAYGGITINLNIPSGMGGGGPGLVGAGSGVREVGEGEGVEAYGDCAVWRNCWHNCWRNHHRCS